MAYQAQSVPSNTGSINLINKDAGVKTRSYVGVGLLILCDFFWATADVIVTDSYAQPCFIAALLGVCQGLSCVVLLKYRGEPLYPDHDRGLLALISFIGLCGTLCIVYGLENLSVGNAVALSSCVPLFAYLFGFMFKVSKCNVLGGVCSVVTVTGGILVAQPSFLFPAVEDDDTTLGLIIASSASVFFGLYIVLVGKYGDRIHHIHQSLYLAVFGLLYLPICALFVGKDFAFPESPLEWWQCWGFALFWGWGTIAAIGGFAMESPVLAGILGTGEIVLAYLFGYIFLGEGLTWWTFIGSALIVVSSSFFAVMDFKDQDKDAKTAVVHQGGYDSLATADDAL